MGVCGCVVVGEGAWLHPSDWPRLLPCRPPPTGQPYDWGREVGRFSLICPGKGKRKRKIKKRYLALFLGPLGSQFHALSSLLHLSLFWEWGKHSLAEICWIPAFSRKKDPLYPECGLYLPRGLMSLGCWGSLFFILGDPINLLLSHGGEKDFDFCLLLPTDNLLFSGKGQKPSQPS